MLHYLVWLIIALNLLGFVLMGADKRRARRHDRRIAERNFFLLAAAGGAVGTLAGMYVFRHKTEKPRFVYGLPAILALQFACLWHFFLRAALL